jgi:hypothetical protein
MDSVKQIANAIETLITETRETGGSTVSITGAPLPDSGYMVGGLVDGLMSNMDVLAPEHDHGLREKLALYVSEHYSLLSRDDVFLGGWIDQKEGTVWFDISERFNVREYAEMIGSDRGELAIWDVDKAEEIRVAVTV